MVVCPEITLLFHRALPATGPVEWRDKVILSPLSLSLSVSLSLSLFLEPLQNLLKKSSACTRRNPRISRFTRRSLAPARARERERTANDVIRSTNKRLNGQTDRHAAGARWLATPRR